MELPKSYVFKGSKEYSTKQLQEMLSLSPILQPQHQGQQPAMGLKQQMPISQSRFLVPLQTCTNQLSALINNLKKDPWPVESDKRPLRSTGCAISVATSLLEVVNMIHLHVVCCAIYGSSDLIIHWRPMYLWSWSCCRSRTEGTH